jgi:hypothetical protein
VDGKYIGKQKDQSQKETLRSFEWELRGRCSFENSKIQKPGNL